MPTKCRHRAQDSRLTVSPAMMAQLQLGHVPLDTPGRAERFFWVEADLAAAWRAFGAQILAAWVAARPGCRPAAWWRFTAPGPRRLPVGASLLETGPAAYLEMRWRRAAGVPAHRRTRTVEDGRLVVESESACLRRLGLLLRDERRALRPTDFEPVAIPIEGAR